jgi:hypothetical protein
MATYLIHAAFNLLNGRDISLDATLFSRVQTNSLNSKMEHLANSKKLLLKSSEELTYRYSMIQDTVFA